MRLGMQQKFKPWVFRNIKKDKNYKVNNFPDLKTDKTGLTSVSNIFSKVITQEDPLAFKWKKGKEESPKTIGEMEKKQKSVSILYNKGNYQVIINSDDVKHLGRK